MGGNKEAASSRYCRTAIPNVSMQRFGLGKDGSSMITDPEEEEEDTLDSALVMEKCDLVLARAPPDPLPNALLLLFAFVLGEISKGCTGSCVWASLSSPCDGRDTWCLHEGSSSSSRSDGCCSQDKVKGGDCLLPVVTCCCCSNLGCKVEAGGEGMPGGATRAPPIMVVVL